MQADARPARAVGSALPGGRRLVEISDVELLERFAGGDDASFSELVRRHGPAIKAFALRLLNSRDDAEDVFAETFLRVARARGAWEDRGTVRAWLFTIARRQCLDVLRHRAVERRAEHQLVELERHRGATPSPEARAMLGQQAERLERALARIPESHREVLLLRTVHGLDARETALAVEITEDQVHSMLSYARKRLRELLDDTGEEAHAARRTL
jgi:RNA polymerase sigma-70 factor (ECF subfamily)